jgi:hypothetical protein
MSHPRPPREFARLLACSCRACRHNEPQPPPVRLAEFNQYAPAWPHRLFPSPPTSTVLPLHGSVRSRPNTRTPSAIDRFRACEHWRAAHFHLRNGPRKWRCRAVRFVFGADRNGSHPGQLRISPEFGPVQVAGRWLGDGGFSLNAPFDPVLEAPASLRLYVVDLYARDGNVPDGLEAAAERKSDLTFGNQTFQRLRHALEARQLRAELQGRDRNDRIYLLSYRPGREEAGPEKSFDLSEAAMAQRWRAGFLDMQHAGSVALRNGICSVRRGSQRFSAPESG